MTSYLCTWWSSKTCLDFSAKNTEYSLFVKKLFEKLEYVSAKFFACIKTIVCKMTLPLRA